MGELGTCPDNDHESPKAGHNHTENGTDVTVEDETNVSKMSEFPDAGNKRSVEMIEEGLSEARHALVKGDWAIADLLRTPKP